MATSSGFARMIPRLNVSVLSQAVEGLELVFGEAVLGGDEQFAATADADETSSASDNLVQMSEWTPRRGRAV